MLGLRKRQWIEDETSYLGMMVPFMEISNHRRKRSLGDIDTEFT